VLDSVSELWDRALIMMNGKIAAIRTRKEVDESGENLEETFFQITEGNPQGPQEDEEEKA
jgi:ABC-2 type transport system ATP-binding protein